MEKKCVNVRECACVCACVCVSVYVCVFGCVYVWKKMVALNDNWSFDIQAKSNNFSV